MKEWEREVEKLRDTWEDIYSPEYPKWIKRERWPCWQQRINQTRMMITTRPSWMMEPRFMWNDRSCDGGWFCNDYYLLLFTIIIMCACIKKCMHIWESLEIVMMLWWRKKYVSLTCGKIGDRRRYFSQRRKKRRLGFLMGPPDDYEGSFVSHWEKNIYGKWCWILGKDDTPTIRWWYFFISGVYNVRIAIISVFFPLEIFFEYVFLERINLGCTIWNRG